MPPVVSKLKGKVLHSQTREVVSNVLRFMEEEAKQGSCIIPISKAQQRTSAAVGIGERTVRKIRSEEKRLEGQNSSFSTPNKKRHRKCAITGLDDFDLCVVRRTVYDFYKVENQLPTVVNLLQTLRHKIDFKGGKTSLRKVLLQLGFKWRKTKTNRKILIEKNDIRDKRIAYLREINRLRKQGRPIIYMDETYILSSHTSSKAWSDDSSEGLHCPVSKGDRLIIVHAGGENGFVENTLLMWKSSQSSGDYHHEMNFNNYQKWVREMLVPNLEPHSVVVIDNAPYHNVVQEKVPNSNSRKSDMIDWLSSQGIPCSENMFKPELYALIKLHKPRNQKYMIDTILESFGHTALRLPPYHPDLNPIETIWAQVKKWVASRNNTFKIDDVQKLCQQKFSEMGEQEWRPICQHVIKAEREYWEREGMIDVQVEKFEICLGSSDNETESGDSEDEDGQLSGVEELN